MDRILDLILFSGSVYGLAWIVVKSKLFAPIRERCLGVPFLSDLVQCVVCTSVWTGFLIIGLLPYTTLFSQAFRERGWVDGFILTGWGVLSSWVVGSKLGDAD